MTKEKKEKLAINLITQKNIKDAAAVVGVSESAVYRLKRTPAFQELLKKTKDAMFKEAMQKAQGMTLEALNTLDEIRGDPNCTDSARVASAKAIIELGMEMSDREMIYDRLQEVEERLAENEGGNYH